MSMAPLVEPSDLPDYPGAPFDESAVEAAGDGLRDVAGWHIAPSVTETLTLDSPGGTHLVLPSLWVTAVIAVNDVSSDDPVEITDFRWSRAGILYRRCGWPCGFQTVEVELTHGYASCPPRLFPAIAAACQSAAINGALASKTIGPFSESYRTADGSIMDPAVARISLPSRP